MSIFDNYLPWTKERLSASGEVKFTHYFLPAGNVIQDQTIPITNLMTLLYLKVQGSVDLTKIQNRLALVKWYESMGKKTFRIDELELLLQENGHEASKKLKKGGINLVGYARSMSGLGDDIRGLMLALEHLGIPYAVICLGHPSDNLMYDDVANEVIRPIYDSSIFCMNGFEFCKLNDIYKSLSDNYGYIVLQAPWELPKLFSDWSSTLDTVDEIWAISRFVETAFINAGFTNVVYNPPIVELAKQGDPKKHVRQKRQFTFLYIFDAASYLSRKNPQAALKCFQEAFQSKENVRLLLKVSNADGSPEFATFEHKCASDKRIIIEKTPLEPQQILNLLNRCDCYLSLHRSEGFGRTIAQASLLAKPVISTNWSGSVDILPEKGRLHVPFKLVAVKEEEYPGSQEQFWAEPDEQIAIDKLKEIYFSNDALRTTIGLENQKFAQTRFTLESSIDHYLKQFTKIINHTTRQDLV